MARYMKDLEEFTNEIQYEELCLVDGELPPKLGWNGSTEGEISTVRFHELF